VFLCVPFEFLVKRLADGNHRGQRKQLAIGERRVRRSRRYKHARETKPSAIELAQRKRLGDRNATLQRRRALRVAQRRQAARESEDDGKKSQRKAHISTNTAPKAAFRPLAGGVSMSGK
jgi:hypothetical protein